jgi:catechol 2,3-dioxygenase-like lactoylglutathione lyase family enzyme
MTQFRYAIKFVADMEKAVKFRRDVLSLKLKFESPGWSEFVTGETIQRERSWASPYLLSRLFTGT